MINCCGLFRPSEVWHLREKDGFHNRRMESGVCPECSNQVVLLVETRYTDNLEISTIYKKRRAQKKRSECKQEVYFKQHHFRQGIKSRMAFRYGENKTVKNSKGDIICVQQVAVDYNGTKEILKKMPIVGLS